MNNTLVTQFGEPDIPYCDPTNARMIIIPAPLEYTVCYIKGTEFGPQAILNASSQMELYDEELDWSPIDIGIYTRSPLDYSGMDHAAALKVTADAVHEVLKHGQLPFILGGEHSLSAPPIAAVQEYYPDLTVVHIDAHADLRNEYLGSSLSHASVARRVVEMGIPITEIGIRSISPEEVKFLRTPPEPDVAIVWAYKLASGNAIIPWERLSKHTYLTIDLDAIDPGEMPAVGTPEPGGLHWYQLLDILREINQRTTIVGMDLVELCPMERQTRADFLAAKLAYKMIGYRFSEER